MALRVPEKAKHEAVDGAAQRAPAAKPREQVLIDE